MEKLARQVGVSASYVYKIEVAERNPSLSLAKQIADVLGVSVEDLFFATEDGTLDTKSIDSVTAV